MKMRKTILIGGSSIAGLFLIYAALVLAGVLPVPLYEKYVPIEMTFKGGDCVLIDRPGWLTPEHLDKMKTVLDKYHEPYRIYQGNLLISARLKCDRELTANYTEKARER
jgi:hypothetical protein